MASMGFNGLSATQLLTAKVFKKVSFNKKLCGGILYYETSTYNMGQKREICVSNIFGMKNCKITVFTRLVSTRNAIRIIFTQQWQQLDEFGTKKIRPVSNFHTESRHVSQEIQCLPKFPVISPL